MAPVPWGDRRRGRIGLLGGSFNPAHDGHRHISRMARRALNLDQVWWLVSPGNPLKDPRSMAPLGARLAEARALSAGDPWLVPTALEAAWGTRRTFDTLATLRRRFPRARFVWLMGMDNLAQFPRWYRWTEIARGVPIAILDRAPYTKGALVGQAARRLAAARIPARASATLADQRPPCWVFLPIRKHPASATAIRARR